MRCEITYTSDGKAVWWSCRTHEVKSPDFRNFKLAEVAADVHEAESGRLNLQEAS